MQEGTGGVTGSQFGRTPTQLPENKVLRKLAKIERKLECIALGIINRYYSDFGRNADERAYFSKLKSIEERLEKAGAEIESYTGPHAADIAKLEKRAGQLEEQISNFEKYLEMKKGKSTHNTGEIENLLQEAKEELELKQSRITSREGFTSDEEFLELEASVNSLNELIRQVEGKLTENLQETELSKEDSELIRKTIADKKVELEELKQQIETDKKVFKKLHDADSWRQIGANLESIKTNLENSRYEDAPELKSVIETQQRVVKVLEGALKTKDELLSDLTKLKGLEKSTHETLASKGRESTTKKSAKQFAKQTRISKDTLMVQMALAASRSESLTSTEIESKKEIGLNEIKELQRNIKLDLGVIKILKENSGLVAGANADKFSEHLTKLEKVLDERKQILENVEKNLNLPEQGRDSEFLSGIQQVNHDLNNSHELINAMGKEIKYMDVTGKARKERIAEATGHITSQDSTDKTHQELFDLQIVLKKAKQENGKVVQIPGKAAFKVVPREIGTASQAGTSEEAGGAVQFIFDKLLSASRNPDPSVKTLVLENLQALENAEWFNNVLNNHEKADEFRINLNRIRVNTEAKKASPTVYLPLKEYVAELKDPSARTIFLNYYKVFFKPKSAEENTSLKMLNTLGNLYDDFNEEGKQTILTIFQEWVDHPEIHGNDLNSETYEFFSTFASEKKLEPSEALRPSIERLEASLNPEVKNENPVNTTPDLKKADVAFDEIRTQIDTLKGAERKKFIKNLAADLTTVEFEKLKLILPSDFVSYIHVKPPDHSVSQAVEQFNQTQAWVVSSILTQKSTNKEPSTRDYTDRIEFFLDLAQELHEQNNFLGEMAIHAALGDSRLNPLDASKKNISKAHKTSWKRLETFFSPEKNYDNYRQHLLNLNKTKAFYLPFLGNFIIQLTFADENPSQDNSANFNKTKIETFAGYIDPVIQMQKLEPIVKPEKSTLANVIGVKKFS